MLTKLVIGLTLASTCAYGLSHMQMIEPSKKQLTRRYVAKLLHNSKPAVIKGEEVYFKRIEGDWMMRFEDTNKNNIFDSADTLSYVNPWRKDGLEFVDRTGNGPSRDDIVFWRKNGLVHNMKLSENKEFHKLAESIYGTLPEYE